MSTVLKRVAFLAFALLCGVVTMFVSLVTAHYEGAAYATDVDRADGFAMVISDVAYKPAVGVGITSKEATPENIAELERVAIEAETETDESIAESEVDWWSGDQSYGCDYICGYDYGYDYVCAEGDSGSGYETLVGACGLVPYDESGYYDANLNGAWYEGSEFAYTGGYLYKDASGMGFTWYSENILPGGGLDIPGRHVGDEGYICDADGNVCLASDNLPKGTIVNIPFGSGTGVVYDKGSGDGNIDVYVSWQ